MAGDLDTARFYATDEVARFLLAKPTEDDSGQTYAFFECAQSVQAAERSVCTFATATRALDMTVSPGLNTFRVIGVEFHDKTSQ